MIFKNQHTVVFFGEVSSKGLQLFFPQSKCQNPTQGKMHELVKIEIIIIKKKIQRL